MRLALSGFTSLSMLFILDDLPNRYGATATISFRFIDSKAHIYFYYS